MRIVLALLLGGCFGWPKIPDQGADPEIRKLADGKVLSLELNLKDQQGLCPGTKGKLYADGMVEWPGQKPVKRFIGNDVDSFAPATFSVKGPLVHGDENAHLHPSNDVAASAEVGFEMEVVYTVEPDRFRWKKVIRPEYSCFQNYSLSGAAGNTGDTGESPGASDIGQHGNPAGHGGQGYRGGDASPIVAFVTVVSTPFYEKLYAVIANDYFYLVYPDQQMHFSAVGGDGGQGGQGGQGGNGGWQPWEEKETYEDGNPVTKRFGSCCAGNGGQGGNGGPGGPGGNGANIDITWDSKFPELDRWIVMHTDGGAGGGPGGRGYGGEGGGTEADIGAQAGQGGQEGQDSNVYGQNGRAGRANKRSGNVSSRFTNIRGIAIYGTQSITTKRDQPPIMNLGGAMSKTTPRPQPSRTQSQPSRTQSAPPPPTPTPTKATPSRTPPPPPPPLPTKTPKKKTKKKGRIF